MESRNLFQVFILFLYSKVLSCVSISLLVAVRVGADESLHGGVGDEGGAVPGEAVSAERVAARGQHLEVVPGNVTGRQNLC